MTVENSVTLTNGLQWSVVSGIGLSDEPAIVIPVKGLESMTDHEIAQAVRGLIPSAVLVGAINDANYVRDYLSREGDAAHALIHCAPDIERMQAFAGQDPDIDLCLALVHQAKANLALMKAKRAEQKARTRPIRVDLQNKYNDVFMALGRRDGFCCQLCNVSTDLKIDHIKPVAKGGTNDLDNLQLLCGPCNLAKSDTWDGDA